MTTLRAAMARLLGTMAGQFFLLLAIGLSLASVASFFVAEQVRLADAKQLKYDGVVASAADIADRLRNDPARTERMLVENLIVGANMAPANTPIAQRDSRLEKALADRLGAQSRPLAGEAPARYCFPKGAQSDQRAAGMTNMPTPDCWIVQYGDSAGVRRSVAIGLTRSDLSGTSPLRPLYLLLIFVSSAVLALLLTRVAIAPLQRLARAADLFSLSTPPDPIPERGPGEVQAALRTFNIMQRRVYDGLHERTQLLAAITHDLQTPLTRLRLRFEQVPDDALRERMIQDAQAMQNLVREGLDLARSLESSEDWSVVDIDSLLASIAEDAQELGTPVVLGVGCAAEARVKPNALVRCLSNLVDNAVKYGGGAELSCRRDDQTLAILVRDRGPGIGEELIGKMFEPFTRGAPSRPGGRSGTGMGLTIARAQAQTFGAEVNLVNHPEGGIVATVEMALA